MTTSTSALGLLLYNNTTDQGESFQAFRTAMAGSANSNMTKIDATVLTLLGRTDATLLTSASSVDSDDLLTVTINPSTSPVLRGVNIGDLLTSQVDGTSIIYSASHVTHGNTSSASSLNNTGRDVVQKLVLDEYGHVTSACPVTVAFDKFNIQAIVGDGANVMTTGVKGYLEVPDDATITSWKVVSGSSGSLVVDLWKSTYADFPPTVADSICSGGSAVKANLAGGQKNSGSTLTGWTTTLSTGDWIAFNVDSGSIVKQATVCISCVRR